MNFKKLTPPQKRSLQFIFLIGIVSLFADITYEGARSITGAYLSVLGASALIVGFVAGLGELIGYSLRLASGFVADKTEKYWTLTIVGYAINLIAVPLLALTTSWQTAAILIVAERMGKAIRVPPRDAMLTYAGRTVGVGFGFGLHEALDQIGAMLGPLMIAAVLYFKGSFHEAFAILGVFSFLSLFTLMIARLRFPQPNNLESNYNEIHTEGINKTFWLYLTGASFIAAGYADFALISYHFQKTNMMPVIYIPLCYALAMGVDSIASLIFGHLYDRKGFIVLIIVTVMASLFGPLVFFGGKVAAFIGVTLWAVGIGAQQTLMRAVVGSLITSKKLSSAYGVFNFSYGISWFLGSILLGFLYDKSLLLLVTTIFILQLASLPWLIIVMRRLKK